MAIYKRILRFLSRFAGKVFRYGSLLSIFVYFFFSLVYTMPNNPIKIGLTPMINLTVGTYFQQNWSLFAPNPVSSNVTLMISPLNDTTSFRNTAVESLRWYDMTTPLLLSFQNNRFSAYERIGRAQGGALRLYSGNDPILLPWRRACENGDTLACKVHSEILKYDKIIAQKTLARVGSSFCNQLFSVGEYKYFALAYQSVNSIEWSRRYEKNPEHTTQFNIIGVYKIDTTITKSTFFQNQ